MMLDAVSKPHAPMLSQFLVFTSSSAGLKRSLLHSYVHQNWSVHQLMVVSRCCIAFASDVISMVHGTCETCRSTWANLLFNHPTTSSYVTADFVAIKQAGASQHMHCIH